MSTWQLLIHSPAAKGFALSASLIIAIGAQNAFVIRQGLRREHVLLIPLVCTLCDGVMIILGAEGFGTLISHFPLLSQIAAWTGAAFLFFYGAKSFYAALNPGKLELGVGAVKLSRRAVVGQTMAFSLLNPHVYIDTVFLIGSVAAQYGPDTRAQFTAGTILASAVWFFGLSFGASLMAPLLKTRTAWRVLDTLIGVMMWSIAYSLIKGVL
jgi:L-lysine exporter family protein LysE/ArgO